MNAHCAHCALRGFGTEEKTHIKRARERRIVRVQQLYVCERARAHTHTHLHTISLCDKNLLRIRFISLAFGFCFCSLNFLLMIQSVNCPLCTEMESIIYIKPYHYTTPHHTNMPYVYFSTNDFEYVIKLFQFAHLMV